MLKKKIWANFQRTFYPKNCHKALKNICLGSGIRKKPVPDPGSRGQKGTGSRIRIRITGNGATTVPIPTFMFLCAIYTYTHWEFPQSVCIFCCRKIGGPIADRHIPGVYILVKTDIYSPPLGNLYFFPKKTA